MSVERIKDILIGIDQDETENSTGWWETEKGAYFGAQKLAEVLDVVGSMEERIAELEARQVVSEWSQKIAVTISVYCWTRISQASYATTTQRIRLSI